MVTPPSSVCRSGSAYLLPPNKKPLTCSPGLPSSTCPAGYTCQQSTTPGTYYCCTGWFHSFRHQGY
ncbi:MAG: hypothetical protein GY696_11865 [Gammaproteobacteria bacterium]|nr:hypothetical protein [Gammaproteobacteria bacterium]